MRLEILMVMGLFFGGSFLSGHAVCKITKVRAEGVLFPIVVGAMSWWALMEILLLPMTMLHGTFEGFVVLYSVVLVGIFIGGLLGWKGIAKELKIVSRRAKEYLTFGHVVALLLILYQLVYLHHHMYLEWDDTYYVNLANEAVNSNRIYWVYPETGAFADFDKRYVLSLWPIFYAWLSKIFGVLPTIMAHTILPWVIIPLSYMVYGLIGGKLFARDKELQGMFLAMAVLLHLFMSGEHTAGLTFLSITPWVGKGVLATVLIPMLFYHMLRMIKREKKGEWILLGLTALGGCLLSSMGIMLTPVFVGGTMLLFSVYRKKVRYLTHGMLACLPCLMLGVYYLYLTH